MNNYKDHIASILSSLPEEPGCYQYFDENEKIIYVGKAKNLKRRVSSYFHKTIECPKTRILVRKIRDIKYIVVKSEEDALLLENSLIKEHLPRYNVMLKDDKTYPSIVVRNELYPRVFATRKIIKDGSSYFGPYSSVGAMKAILHAIKEIYALRTCKHAFTPENITNKKYPVCLQYHIKNCKGPCQCHQTEKDYLANIEEIKEILGGNISKISKQIMENMKHFAENLQFEQAQELKEKYGLIEKYKVKSEIVSPHLHDIDVFSYDGNEQSAYINYLHVLSGTIVQGYTIEYKKRIDEPKEEIFALGIAEMRTRFKSETKEILVPFIPEVALENVQFTIPIRGDKKKLLDLSLQNVRQYKLDQLKRTEKLNPEQRTTRLLKEIQDALRLPKMPIHIECFDNSNIQGSDAVAACVVFMKGKPAKNEYRKYNIKTVEGADDYASMKEVVYRRYKRLIDEASPLPDLIFTDGGKGQMEVVREVIQDILQIDIPIAGLVKNKKHRTSEVLYGFPPMHIGLVQNSPLFHLLERIQDEVHRFAITFHKEKRSKRQIASELDSIKGIGGKTKTLLIQELKSVKRIKEASIEDIAKITGMKKAIIIKGALTQ